MTSNKLTGWFSEQIVNGTKSLIGRAYASNDSSAPVSVIRTSDSFTFQAGELTISFPCPFKSESLQTFTTGSYELVVKKKTKNKKSYFAFVLNILGNECN